MDASTFKAELRILLGDTVGEDGWEDALLQEALSQGLADANTWALAVESCLPATVAGCEHDISSLDALQVYAVACPWHEEVDFRARAVTWRLVATTVIHVDTAPLEVGDTLRIRYRKRYFIAGLSGATQTTLPATLERTVLLAAAAHAYLIRYRQLSRRPSTAPSDLAACKDLANIYTRKFEAAVLGDTAPLPAWGTIGL